MSAGKYPRTFPPDEASSWRRIRRYAIPRWMIKQATERRLAGDWRGACETANVDVTFDLADVANEHGQATATRLEEDLRHFAPDLVRWHLPRYLRGRTTLRPDQRVLLAGYGDQPTDGPYLYATTMPMIDGPQRLTVRFGDIGDIGDIGGKRSTRPGRLQDWTTSRYLWDTRHSGELRERCGIGPHAERVAVPQERGKMLPDLQLLQFGDITPEQLHPLVSASLFPERPPEATDGPPEPELSALARVRCRGEWHEIRSADGRLHIPHTEEEERRERAMRALGGPVSGCFAVRQAWESGTGWLPKTLRAQRREFFSLVQHGDTPNVLRLLDAGMDPHIRDGRQRTLLHLLHLLDHKLLLPRLLKAGLDLEARDHNQRTPLHVAVGEGPESLVHALLDAGARIDVMDNQDRALSSLILFRNRTELRFLIEAVFRNYPNLPGVILFPARGDITYEDLTGMLP